jgi:transcriptional regulator with XRE-family HTH domain
MPYWTANAEGRMSDLSDWRERLRDAVNRSGKKHYVIAEDAGVTRATLSRILTGAHPQPKFETILRIAHAAGENVGYLAGEQGFSLSSEQRARVQAAAVILIDLTRGRSR